VHSECLDWGQCWDIAEGPTLADEIKSNSLVKFLMTLNFVFWVSICYRSSCSVAPISRVLLIFDMSTYAFR
jgi:hypothetical protein